MIFLTDFLRSAKSKHFILVICFVSLTLFAVAQTGVVNNGAKMIINSGAVMKITGSGADYTNATSGSTHGRIDLDGKIELQGDWTNNATSGNVLINVDTDGEVIFNGSSTQNISGSATSDFEKLTINNSSGLSLSADAEVGNVLTLSNGLVTLNSSNLIIGTGGSIPGTFDATRMFVTNSTGTLRKSFASVGSFTFPIGENTGTAEYSPVDLTLNSGTLSSAYISVNVTDAKHPENTSPSEYLTRYWTLASSGITSPNYSANFTYLQADAVGTEADIYAAEYDGSTRSLYGMVNASTNLLSVTGLSNFADYTGVDGTVPTTLISTTEPNDPTNTTPIPFKVTFSEEVTGFVIGDIVVTNGTAGSFSTSDNIEFTFNVTPAGDGDVKVDVAAGVAKDLAGNDNTAAGQFSILYDGTSPTVVVSTLESSPTNNSPFEVTITFNEEVQNFVAGDISVTNGSAGNLLTSDDITFTADITPAGDLTVSISVPVGVAEDLAGNGNEVSNEISVDYDSTSPTVTLSTLESSPTNSSPFEITIEFSEEVIGFALVDIVVVNGTVDNLVTSDDITFTADITPGGDGTVTVDIAADVAVDAATNGNEAASQFSITYDGTSPGVTITSGESDPTNSLFDVSIHFDEVVTEFVIGDVTVVNGTKGTFTPNGNDQDWTLQITPTADGLVTVDIAADVAIDAATNGNTAATQFSITYDGTSPGVEITSGEPDPTNGSFSVSIHFDESVTGFISDDVTVSNCTKGTFAGSGQDYTLVINPTSNGLVTVDIAANVAIDVAGNGNTIAAQFSITYDGTAPTVAISSLETSPSNADPISVTITFSEEVIGFALVDIVVVNGTVDNLVTSDDITFTADITPGGDGTVTVDIAADVAIDAATNGNTAASQFSIDYDGTSPTTIISTTEPNDPTNTNPLPFKVTFSEEVTGFVIGDIIVTNGTASNFNSTSNPEFTFDITPSGQGEITIDVAGAVAQDLAGNDNTAATQYTIEYDSAIPTVSGFNPADGNPEVSVTTNLEINFNEVVNAVSGNITLFKTGVGSVETFDVTTDIMGDGTTSITVNPTVDLSSATAYHVQIDASAFDDEAGNSYAGISDETTWNFTSADVNDPQITGLSPIDNALNVTLTSDLVVTFSENIYKGSGDIVIWNASTASIHETIGVSTGQVTISANEATINPSINFVGESNYYVLIDATAFEDATSNTFAGISNSETWNFTTEDVAPPTISSTTPTDDAQDVVISSDLIITFNENVVKGSGNIIITNATTSSQHESIDVTTGQVTINSNEVTINPNTDFNGESDYYVEFVSGVFVDESANDFAGISGVDTWNFTTEDVAAPTVVVSTAESDPTNSTSFSVTITFNEEVQNFVLGDISVTNGVASGLGTSDNITYTVNIAPDTDGNVAIIVLAGVAQDLAGNANEVSNQLDIEYDGTSPTVTLSTLETDPTNSSPFQITIEFSEVVSGFDFGDITVGNGAADNVNTSDNITFTADITPTADGAVTVDLAADIATDPAGNGNIIASQLSITYDSTSPTVVISSAENDPTNVSPFEITIEFSEVVSGFDFSDITVGNGTAGNVNTSDNITFTADITPAGDGAVTIDIAADVATDLAGNGNTIASQLSINYDSTSPTVVISSAENDPTNVSPFEVTITFNEKVQNFTAGDISVTNGSADNLLTSDDITFTADITPAGELTISIIVTAGAAEDLAGNVNIISNEISVDYDSTSPTVTLSTLEISPTNSSPFEITIEFSEVVSGFDFGDITVGNGTVNNVNTSDNITFTADVTPTADGLVTVDIAADAAQDAATNGNTAATQFSITYDGTSPGVTITSAEPDPTNVSPFEVTIVFSEEVTGFEIGDVIVVNGAAANLNTSDNITFTADIIPVADGIVTFDIAGGVATDAANNGNTASSQFSINYDSTSPTVILSTLESSPTNSSPFEITIEFSEEVDGFDFGDITVGNGSAANLNTSDNITFTADITSTADGLVTVDIAADVATDIAGNGNIAASQLSITYDGTSPGVTITSTEPDPTNVSPFEVTIAFSEVVTGFEIGDIIVGNGTATNLNTSDNTTFTADITPTADGQVTVDINAGVAQDNATNTNTVATQFSIEYNSQIPGVTITSSEADPTNNSLFSIDIVFTEAVTGFDLTDINVTNGSASDLNTTDDISFTANITPTADGAVTVQVPADVVVNSIGTNNTASNVFSIVFDSTSPTISVLSPADNVTNVTVNSDLQITFSENVVANTGNITIMNSTTSATHEVIDVTTGLVSISTNTVTINPSIDFDENISYYVLIDNGAFHDGAGNSFTGISGTTTWNFTTADVTLPTILTLSPTDDAINVTVNSDLQITFSENVVANTGLIIIMDATSTHESIDVLSGQVSIVSDVVTINPGFDFDGESDYYVLIDNDAFHDESGNSFAGISDPTTWNFTTEDISQPSVTITSSESGTVTGNFDVTITFSETVTGFTSDDVTVANGSVNSFTESTAGQIWTVTIEPVTDGNVTVDISAGVAQDAAGNVNTAAGQFSIYYDSGVGFEDMIPYEISIYSLENRVIVEFTNEGNYQFKEGIIEVYNLLGQKITGTNINDFVKFETKVDHVSQIYIVKVIIDGVPYTKRLYIE